MKIIAFAFLLVGSWAYADSITCTVPPSSSSSSVVIQLDTNKQGVASIDYNFQAKDSNGFLVTKVERIFSRWPLIRGELTVDYCGENDNKYQEYDGSYSIWSVCAAPSGMVGQIVFQADFTAKDGGKITFFKADGITTQEVDFSNCK